VRRALLALLLCWAALAPALAQPAAARPAWGQLTPQQREALAPLAGDWESFDADRQHKLHERMREFARLSPEQKRDARDNFKKLYELPAEERQARVQQFQELTPEQKRALAEQAQQGKKAAEPPPRRGNPPAQ
jgi:hypothetical protein